MARPAFGNRQSGYQMEDIRSGVDLKKLVKLIIGSLEGALMISGLERDREALLETQSHLEHPSRLFSQGRASARYMVFLARPTASRTPFGWRAEDEPLLMPRASRPTSHRRVTVRQAITSNAANPNTCTPKIWIVDLDQ